MLPPCTKRHGLKICVFPQPDGSRYRIEALRGPGDKDAGELILERRDLKGQPTLRVTSIETMPDARRMKAGTAMYEEALAIACRLGAALVSDYTRSAYAESFWRKQKARGRAKCIRPNPGGSYNANYYEGPLLLHRDMAKEECFEKHSDGHAQQKCVDAKMKSVSQGLPKPRRVKVPPSSGENRYWPCGVYAVKKTHCKDGALNGLPRRRK